MTKEATSLKLDETLMKKVKQRAQKENRSIGNFIETILRNYFEEIEKTKNPE